MRETLAVIFIALIASNCTLLSAQQAASPWDPVPPQAVIAHRGASYYAPEATRPAYLLARDLGATYLELDLQRTADGVLVAFHDDDPRRTTNVAAVFPGREEEPISAFTWAELQQLDAGVWFNEDEARVDRARDSFVGLRILTLEEVIDIAEAGDRSPGLYIETKLPDRYPGIEEQLAEVLRRRGWYPTGEPAAEPPAPGARDDRGYARVILQTFDRESLGLLRRYLPRAPALLLLWLGEGYMPDDSPETYAEWIGFAARSGAAGIGPDYENLAAPWAVEMIHEQGLFVHAYTVDDRDGFATLSERGVDGFFTNRPDLLLEYYGRIPDRTVEEILGDHGYRQ